jgi:hypothetical protein
MALLISSLLGGCTTVVRFPGGPPDPPITVTGIANEAQGADLAIANLDQDSRPEMVLMAYNNPGPGANTFRYKVGWNLNFSGIASRWSDQETVPGVGYDGSGAGIAIIDLDKDPGGRPEMILMAYDDAPGLDNAFRYRIGWNLQETGKAESWNSDYVEVPGLGLPEGQGAGLEVAYLDDNDSPDMVVVVYANTAGTNPFLYKIGWNLDASGVTLDWSDSVPADGLGDTGQGAGVAIANIGGTSRPEMVLMAYDDKGRFRARIGLSLGGDGVAASWSRDYSFPGLGRVAQGTGIELANLDDNPKPDAIVMVYSDPDAGPNTFNYRIAWNIGYQDGLTVAGWGDYFSAPHVGKAQGAGLALLPSPNMSYPELVLMAYRNLSGENQFRYRVAWQVSAQGNSDHVSPGYIRVPGVGKKGEGAGIAFTYLAENPAMFFTAYNDPAEAGHAFRYRMFRNFAPILNQDQVGELYSEPIEVEDSGGEGAGAGAGIAFAYLDADPRPDMIVMFHGDPDHESNQFRWRVGWNVKTDGRATSWSELRTIQGVSLGSGYSPNGAGIAIAKLDADPRPDMIVMAYVPVPQDRNMFRYRIAWNLKDDGQPTVVGGDVWTVPGVGYGGSGADIAVGDLGVSDGVLQMILMAYDASGFRYKVVHAPH